MARRCDRCRAEYETGADLGGHDYCMTCYVQMKQAAELRRREEERRNQEKIGLVRRDMHADYMKRKSESEELERSRREEISQRQAVIQKGKRESQMDEMRKRERWRVDTRKKIEAPQSPLIFTPLAKRKKPPAFIAPRQGGHFATAAAQSPIAPKKEKGAKAKKPAGQQPKSGLSLFVESGLPVSLSVGQRQLSVSLIGKNSSVSPLAVSLSASASDSQNKAVPLKMEPRSCTIGPEGEARFKLSLDLPEDVSRGRLELVASLKENAVYIDRQPAKSNDILLSSQVKSPMDLEYRQGSAKFADGALMLTFNNVGESGGILEKPSKATLFAQGVDGSEGKTAHLSSRTKVKGGEKGIQLAFSPSEPMEIGRIELCLEGKDSNGKPYSLKSRFDEAKKKLEGNEKAKEGKE